MENVYPILIDIGVLGFFGFLFYFFQKRRIIRNSTYEIQHRLQKVIFDLHTFLDGKNEQVFYSELNAYAETLEKIISSDNILEQKECLTPPQNLPDEIKAEIIEIINLF